MIRRIFVCCPRDKAKHSKKGSSTRYMLSGKNQGKKAFKRDVYTILLEIIMALNDQNYE